MILGSFSKDIVDHIADVQFERAQRYDYPDRVSSNRRQPARCTRPGELYPACTRVEPFRERGGATCALVFDSRRSRSRRPRARHRQLLRLIDLQVARRDAARRVEWCSPRPSPNRCTLKVGDPVTVETMEGERRALRRPNRGPARRISPAPSVYMDLDALNRLLREGAHHLRRVYQFRSGPRVFRAALCRAEESRRAWPPLLRNAPLSPASGKPSRKIFCGCASLMSSSVAPSRRVSFTTVRASRCRNAAASWPRCVSSASPGAKFRPSSLAKSACSLPRRFRLGCLSAMALPLFDHRRVADRDAAFSPHGSTRHLRLRGNGRSCSPPSPPARSCSRQLGSSRSGGRFEITGLTSDDQTTPLRSFSARFCSLARSFTPFSRNPFRSKSHVVTRGPLQVTVNHEGRTRIKERYVVSAPLSGRLSRVELHPGDPIKAKETLLTAIQPADPALLDPRARAEAEARVNAADADEESCDPKSESCSRRG